MPVQTLKEEKFRKFLGCITNIRLLGVLGETSVTANKRNSVFRKLKFTPEKNSVRKLEIGTKVSPFFYLLLHSL